MAQLLTFYPYLQEAVDAGCLSLESAWRLYWELEVLSEQPWTPGVQEIDLSVLLHHLEIEGMPLQ